MRSKILQRDQLSNIIYKNILVCKYYYYCQREYVALRFTFEFENKYNRCGYKYEYVEKKHGERDGKIESIENNDMFYVFIYDVRVYSMYEYGYYVLYTTYYPPTVHKIYILRIYILLVLVRTYE